jgi:alcohol dehydrogenase
MIMTNTMKAVALKEYLAINEVESFLDVELPKPQASGHDILVKVDATSVNPVDTKVRSGVLGNEPETEPRVIGWDAVGIVESVGEAVTLFKAGDKVYYAGDITRAGSNSEFQLVDERIVGFAPKSLTNAEAAAMPLTTITAYEALFDRLGINPDADNSNKSILIIGGAGGVGSIAIQLAKKIAGLKVIATASKQESIDWCLNLGADYTINHREDMKQQLTELGLTYTDYIFCLNDTEGHFDSMVDIIKPQGKIATIVETKNPLDITKLQGKSATFVWELMYTRSLFQTEDMIEQHHLLNKVGTWFDEGIIRPTLCETIKSMNAESLKKAHTMVESGRMIGKVVVEY